MCEKYLCYAPGTKVVLRKTPQSLGVFCHVDIVSVKNGVPEYNLLETGAWFKHDRLELVSLPTEETLLLISSYEYDLDDGLFEELYFRQESGDR